MRRKNSDSRPSSSRGLSYQRLIKHRFCPRCGRPLIQIHCKIKCRCCGFMLDCTDG